MLNFKNKYKEYYSRCNLDNDAKSRILNNISVKKYHEKKKINRKWILIPITICIMCFCIFLGNPIISAIKGLFTYHTNRLSGVNNVIVSNPVFKIKNKNAYNDLTEFDEINIDSLEKILEVNILSNKLAGNNVKISNLLDNNGKLAYAQFTLSEIDMKSQYESADNDAHLKMYFSVLTQYYPEEKLDDNTKIFEVSDPSNLDLTTPFACTDCTNDNFDIVNIKSKGTQVYFLKGNSKLVIDPDDNQFKVICFFNYKNVLYYFVGYGVSRNMLIDFINTLE